VTDYQLAFLTEPLLERAHEHANSTHRRANAARKDGVSSEGILHRINLSCRTSHKALNKNPTWNESNHMNGSLGRDRLWNQQIWSDIDKVVQEEMGRIRVAQKVFPSTVVNNVLPVSANRVVPFGYLSMPPPPPPVTGDDEFQPLFEISMEFVLTQAQVDGEENVRLGRSLARSAASAIADAEDTILFLGPDSIPAILDPAGVIVTNQPAVPPGFVAEAGNYLPTPILAGGAGQPPQILTAVADGIAELNARDQPGPYALLLSPFRYAQTFAPAPGLLLTPGDQLIRVVTGGFYIVNRLAQLYVGLVFLLEPPDDDIGILVSLGGEPTKITLGTDATTAFTHTDVQGNYHFRVFERVQLVVRDGRAFQILQFP